MTMTTLDNKTASQPRWQARGFLKSGVWVGLRKFADDLYCRRDFTSRQYSSMPINEMDYLDMVSIDKRSFNICLFNICLFNICSFNICSFNICSFNICSFNICLFIGIFNPLGKIMPVSTPSLSNCQMCCCVCCNINSSSETSNDGMN
ncbi:hypothetical protein HELRODRAFT_191762 [Helobdella robusta]|uniref:Uncharacterized protein n=1 Tax=Helobdella robusta TaxID=6412 RepID=T1FTA6_HELRO|nr:hypothetical protein HELRODRAFT_191762 [Helobdella robusta]ESO04341.1 hypothetical protein HELRODRAFT_191762 [Helobdella robusta]